MTFHWVQHFMLISCYCNTLQHTATHSKTQQDTARHCKTLQHTTTHCNSLQHFATHCNTLHHTATHYNRLLRSHSTATQRTKLYHNAPHYNTLQHAATPLHYHSLPRSFLLPPGTADRTRSLSLSPQRRHAFRSPAAALPCVCHIFGVRRGGGGSKRGARESERESPWGAQLQGSPVCVILCEGEVGRQEVKRHRENEREKERVCVFVSLRSPAAGVT